MDPTLVREPPKKNPKPGEPKTYDSVKVRTSDVSVTVSHPPPPQGTLRGLNEFIVYNAYRVMPEYLIEYSSSPSSANLANIAALANKAKRRGKKRGKKKV